MLSRIFLASKTSEALRIRCRLTDYFGQAMITQVPNFKGETMKEIRIHGRGGQGSVTAAELLATSFFEDGKVSQAFPMFGSERMGAPVQAFVRVDSKPIRTREQVHHPDYIIVQDPTLIGTVNVLDGIKDDTLILVNTEKKPEELGFKTTSRVVTVNASGIAREVIGVPIPNTVLLGAFAGASGEVSLESLKKAVKARFRGEVGEKNAVAVEKAFRLMKGG